MKSDSIKELAVALAKAQGQMQGAKKDSKGNYSAYADLASVWEACREPLSSNGLSIVQLTDSTNPDLAAVTTMLLHSSGEWLESYLAMKPTQSTPQGFGSALTYIRRYSLMAMVGIAPADDDGQAASEPVKTGKPAAQRTSQPVSMAKPAPPPPAQSKAQPPHVQSILKTMIKNRMKIEQIFQIGGIDTLDGIDEATAAEVLNKLDFHLKEVKEA